MRIIAGEARGRKLLTPRDGSIRPPLDKMRGSIFSVVGDSIERMAVLDLFAGVGSMGLEAVSRGARRAIFVDKSPASLDILRRNIEALGFGPRTEVIQGDALRVPDLAQADFPPLAFVFLDPPFPLFKDAGLTRRLFDRVGEILRSSVLVSGANVFLRVPASYLDSTAISEHASSSEPISSSEPTSSSNRTPTPREVRSHGESRILRWVR